MTTLPTGLLQSSLQFGEPFLNVLLDRISESGKYLGYRNSKYDLVSESNQERGLRVKPLMARNGTFILVSQNATKVALAESGFLAMST
jgi:hypothetical protein